MGELVQSMGELEVRGTTTAAGYLVFSVIDFVQRARIDTPTYEEATRSFSDLRRRHNEVVRHEVVMVTMVKDGGTYRTETMKLRGLQRLLMMLVDKVEPEFERTFQGIITQFMSGDV